MNQFVTLKMAPDPVGLANAGKIKHDAAYITGERLVQIFLDDAVTAVPVGNAGHRVGSNGKIQLSVIFLKVEEKAEIHKDK